MDLKVGEYNHNSYVFANFKSVSFYVWPVRSGKSGAFGNAFVWATGQTTSYTTGDDGDIRAGVAWPNPRFTKNSDNATVIDNMTGLMWTKDANLAGKTTWQGALDYIASMNNGAGTYGHKDWRLPNRTELLSLVDYGMYGPAIQSDYPFTNTLCSG
ncbi:protein containing DUF1566 [Candidatus Magnetobacterium bavaricum]|uniref:Protein containing DUF1566 n=1 Tax=Candidatus Magnetobacterium bavaricum TaxID=29290 RepID=A0A0F3GM17_9BACT|nr:protein containing DUF1566 [Candidatus Magnetobacterium bavaricum]